MITVRTTEPYVGLKAKDASGKVLGPSRAVKLQHNAWDAPFANRPARKPRRQKCTEAHRIDYVQLGDAIAYMFT